VQIFRSLKCFAKRLYWNNKSNHGKSFKKSSLSQVYQRKIKLTRDSKNSKSYWFEFFWQLIDIYLAHLNLKYLLYQLFILKPPHLRAPKELSQTTLIALLVQKTGWFKVLLSSWFLKHLRSQNLWWLVWIKTLKKDPKKHLLILKDSW